MLKVQLRRAEEKQIAREVAGAKAMKAFTRRRALSQPATSEGVASTSASPSASAAAPEARLSARGLLRQRTQGLSAVQVQVPGLEPPPPRESSQEAVEKASEAEREAARLDNPEKKPFVRQAAKKWLMRLPRRRRSSRATATLTAANDAASNLASAANTAVSAAAATASLTVTTAANITATVASSAIAATASAASVASGAISPRRATNQSFQAARDEFMLEVRSRLDVVYVDKGASDPEEKGKSYLRVVVKPTFT